MLPNVTLGHSGEDETDINLMFIQIFNLFLRVKLFLNSLLGIKCLKTEIIKQEIIFFAIDKKCMGFTGKLAKKQ